MYQIDTVELTRAVLTASLTVLGGIIVLVIGQLLQKFFIEPLHELSKTIGETSFALVYYANLYSNPGTGKLEEMDEASKNIRRLAAKLVSSAHAVRGYGLLSLIRAVPRKRDVNSAASSLIGLSNSFHHGESSANVKRRTDIQKLLRLKLLE